MRKSKVVLTGLLVVSCLVAAPRGALGDLIAYYPFDGDAIDATGNGNDGTEYGGFSYIGGVDGQAVSLDGATGYVDLLENTNLDGFDAFTVAVWIRPATDLNSSTGRQDFLYKGAPVQNGASYALGYDDRDGNLTVSTHSTNWFDEELVAYETEFPANEWFHLAFTYDGISEVRMYVDGVQVGAADGPGMNGTFFDNSSPLTVGRRTDSQYYFNGSVDELRIYNRALTQIEIAGIPEPATLALLAFGGLAAVRRRRS